MSVRMAGEQRRAIPPPMTTGDPAATPAEESRSTLELLDVVDHC